MYKVPFIDYPKHYRALKKEIDHSIVNVLSRGELILRKEVTAFEKRMARFLGVKYAVGVNSCTDALMLSLRASGIGAGDEVITVSHTFVASIAAIVHTGATPILVDIGDDYVIDLSQVEKAITKNTRALIPVHLNGRVCQMDTLMRVARKYKLLLIEDAAQALGATYRGKKAGSWGLTGCFSFYPAKLLGAFGDAGLVATSNKTIYEKIKLYRDHGRKTKDTITCFGVTSRLDNLQAAILNVKFPHIKSWIAKRQKLANLYNKELKNVNGITLPPSEDSIHNDVYQNYVIRAKSRDALKEYLIQRGIETIVSNPIPPHKQRGLGLSHFMLPKTEQFAKEVISLPLIPELNDQQIIYVINAIKSFYKQP